jgi:hypothetical protein
VTVEPAPNWDRALRALVADAWEKRGTDELLPACRQIVDAHTLWPIITVNREVELAHCDHELGVQGRLDAWRRLEPTR